MGNGRAVTLLGVVVGVAVVVVLGVLAIVVILGFRVARGSVAQMADATQVRGIQQAMSIWANQNSGMYPLPSEVDAAGTTIPGDAAAKNTTANIMSLLVYTGHVSAEGLVSPAESNPRITAYGGYSFDRPAGAARPADAMWDPSFSADFTSAAGGHVSYAHVAPVGERLGQWRDGVASVSPVVGNRGPEVKAVGRDKDGRVVPWYVLKDSRTFKFYGSRDSWAGNVAYNDGHVNFEGRTDPEGVMYKDAAGKMWTDCLFYDEPDDAAGLNAWMSIWVKAGAEKGDFKGTWD